MVRQLKIFRSKFFDARKIAANSAGFKLGGLASPKTSLGNSSESRNELLTIIHVNISKVSPQLKHMALAEASLPKNSQWAAFEQLFAGISAGVVTTICTHPLDLIKTRMQSVSKILNSC
jgi:hypothetical protein